MKKIFLPFLYILLLVFTTNCDSDASQNASPNTSGVGGSMARFAIKDNQLYTVGYSTLSAYDISNPQNPTKDTSVSVGWDAETIFPYQNNLFIGTQTGMLTFDITNPKKPVFLSRYQHLRTCDPVVVQGKYAYVTMRSTGTCGADNLNALDILDMTNLNAPVRVNRLNLLSPYGLGIDGKKLFVCEGINGLNVYNLNTDYTIPTLIQNYKGFDTYDVIPLGNVLLLSTKQGIYQYSYSQNTDELVFLSLISFKS
jgi:hypothetical protein